MAKADTLRIKVKIDISLWSIIKLRLAGINIKSDVTIQDLIDREREMKRAI